ncbi:MAG: GGDEF domain-containing protein [Myxococcota bacterium]|nr:GGDEF domain-containing protein [Myxococcota bacterium]
MRRNLAERYLPSMVDNPRQPPDTDTVLNEPIKEKTMLVALNAGNPGERIHLDPRMERVVIGRDDACDLTLDDDSISRQHCVVSFESDRWFMEDLKSTNGTYVAHQYVDRVPLAHGDLVAVGRLIFRFLFTRNLEECSREEMYRLGMFDSLTQVHNRRYLFDFLEREMSRCRRRKHALSLILFEVCGFDGINQRYGYLSGDHVLRELAARLSRRVRREELLARYHGDQFALVLPETTADEAEKFAQIIEHTISVMDIHFDGWKIPVTVRLSVAEFSTSQPSPENLLQTAERRLIKCRGHA